MLPPLVGAGAAAPVQHSAAPPDVLKWQSFKTSSSRSDTGLIDYGYIANNMKFTLIALGI